MAFAFCRLGNHGVAVADRRACGPKPHSAGRGRDAQNRMERRRRDGFGRARRARAVGLSHAMTNVTDPAQWCASKLTPATGAETSTAPLVVTTRSSTSGSHMTAIRARTSIAGRIPSGSCPTVVLSVAAIVNATGDENPTVHTPFLAK